MTPSASRNPPTVKIVPVLSWRDSRRFVNLPWQIYDRSRYPQWVPPLRSMVREALDTKRNPFYQHAAIQLFLAERDGRAVGRIAAIENRAHNRFHEDSIGFFGFLELVDDPEAAHALIEAASLWLGERGMTALQGPVSPSTNHECGLLVSGFEHHSMIMTPWNPPYYAELLEQAGLTPVKDLLGYLLPLGNGFVLPDRIERMAEYTKSKLGLTFRSADMSRYKSEVALCWEIYNEALARIFFGIGKVKRGRILALGVRAKYRRRGILPLFLHEATRRGQAIDAIEAEASWILDDNEPMRAVMKAMGSDVYRRWRLYRKPIGVA